MQTRDVLTGRGCHQVHSTAQRGIRIRIIPRTILIAIGPFCCIRRESIIDINNTVQIRICITCSTELVIQVARFLATVTHCRAVVIGVQDTITVFVCITVVADAVIISIHLAGIGMIRAIVTFIRHAITISIRKAD